MLKTVCIMLHLCNTVSGPAMVIDGDTIIVENLSIRIAGLDAEELKEPHGLMAKRGMLMMVGFEPVTCTLTGDKSYNRYVAICYSHTGMDLAADMVRFGYALDCARYSKGKYRDLEPKEARKTLTQKPYC